jgi:DNA polymerase
LQLSLLHPRLIITLGRYSLNYFFPHDAISKVHGKPKKSGDIIYYPLYHPAAALHQARMRQIIQEDFSLLPSVLKSTTKVGERPDQPQQLSLF